MLPFSLIATRTRVTALLATSLLLAPLGRALAQPKATVATAQLEVTADASCATRAELMARVRLRSPRVAFVEDAGALAVRVRFSTLRAGGVTGELTLARPGTTPSTRRVVARSCAEAADAVALIIAVTLDPASAERATATARMATAPADAARATGTAEANDGSAPNTPRAPAASATATVPAGKPGAPANAAEGSRAVGPSAASASQQRPFFGAGVGAEALDGPAPGSMPGLGLYVLAGLDRRALWSPAVLVRGMHAWRSGVDEPGGRASFALDAASFDACPLRWRLSPVEARPCASAVLGRLAVRGTHTLNPRGESVRPFGVVGGSALVTVKLVGRLEGSARFAVGANLVRDSFEFGSEVFRRVAPLTVSGSVGLGVRWP